MSDEIDWNEVQEFPEAVVLNLGKLDMHQMVNIEFKSLKKTEGGHLVAKISSVDGDWNTMWLKGAYGAQNGLMSLIKAAGGDGDNIAGNKFTVTKAASEMSSVGYAFSWKAV